jgi:tetratricopeptide (TPR) repeat protein
MLTEHPDLGDDPQRLTALTVLALSAGWSADPERSGRVGEQLLSLAQNGDHQSLMLGNWALGFSHWLRGHPVPAREHLSRALALYNPEANRPLGGLVAADPSVMAQAMLGAVLWQLGYPEQGSDSLRRAVVQAQALQQPSSVAFAHYIAAMVTSVVGRDMAAAQSHCVALRPLGQVSLVYRAWVEMVAAWEQAQCGQASVAPAELRLQQGTDRAVEVGSALPTAGSGGGYAGLMLLQADVCVRSGEAEMGLRALDQAHFWAERTGMRAAEAETWRMRGELLLTLTHGHASASGSVEEAEACFQRALALARDSESRWWELGAALSLARLLQEQGRVLEARELLSDIYDWFTEGFDTADLVEAKALLEALG